MIKSEKEKIITGLRDRFQESSSAICVNFLGVNVQQITQFRRELQQVSVDYKVVKNTLAKRAIEGTSFQELDQFLVGPTGIVFCPGEVAEPAKVVTKFAEKHENVFQIKGGIVEGAIFDAKAIQKVATLPSHQELLAQLVSSLQSPISGLVGTLQGVLREFVYTVQAVAEKKAEE